MLNKIILERINGEIESEADTKDIRGIGYLMWWGGSFWEPTNRIRDGAHVYKEWKPKDTVVDTLMNAFHARYPTTSPADTSHPTYAISSLDHS